MIKSSEIEHSGKICIDYMGLGMNLGTMNNEEQSLASRYTLWLSGTMRCFSGASFLGLEEGVMAGKGSTSYSAPHFLGYNIFSYFITLQKGSKETIMIHFHLHWLKRSICGCSASKILYTPNKSEMKRPGLSYMIWKIYPCMNSQLVQTSTN